MNLGATHEGFPLPEKVELMKILTMDRGRLGSPVSLPLSISMNSSSMEVFAGLLGNGSLKPEEFHIPVHYIELEFSILQTLLY